MKGDWVVTTGKFKLNLHGIFTRDLFWWVFCYYCLHVYKKGGDAGPCLNLSRLQLQSLFHFGCVSLWHFPEEQKYIFFFYIWMFCRVLVLSIVAFTAHTSCLAKTFYHLNINFISINYGVACTSDYSSRLLLIFMYIYIILFSLN
jgi:hypothetical protein